MRELRAAEGRRDGMKGIAGGIDRESTRWLLEEGGISDYQAGCLRSILTGAVCTEERASRHFGRGSPECPFCNTKQLETRFHLWWKCPRWQKHR